jgi:predicted Zn finger-like uncharacterized protein
MNIACTSCSARYGVADDKITGKRVRITCKRCGTVLVVDGTNSPPTVSASTSISPAAPAAGRRPSAAPEATRSVAPAPTPVFLVAFPDERQERADVAQIVRFHRAGQLGPQTLVWREGMAEWANPWDVEDIAAAFRRMGYTRPTPPPAAPPPAAAADDEPTQIGRSTPYNAPLFSDDETTSVVDSLQQSRSGGMAPGSSPVTASDDDMPTRVGRASGTASSGRSKMNPDLRTTRREPVVERRVARKESARPEQRSARTSDPAKRRDGRRSELPPRGDLFARQAQAGSEEEEARARVAAAEAQAAAEAHALADSNAPRLTGARNETSVLFSLDSLLKQDQKPAPAAGRSRAPQQDESLLVDSGSSLPMGGGSFSPALAAPDFTAPVSAPPVMPVFASDSSFDMPKPKGSRTWLVATLVGVTALLGGFVFASGGVAPALVKVGLRPAPAPSIPAVPIPSAEKAPAPDTSSTGSPSPEPSASASTSASAVAAAPTAAAPAAPTPTTPRVTSTSSRPSEPVTPKPATPAPESEPAAEPEAESPSSGSSAAAFDASAAKTVLTAAAGNASSCKQADGPTGSGRVSITFAPSGRPTSVAVTGDVAGSAVGSCVAKLFRQTRVPAFSGDPVTVAKGFTVE